jgi:hypothetical protein
LTRRPRPWIHLVVACLAIIPVACEYGGPTTKDRVYSKPPISRRRTESGVADSPAQTVSTSSSSSSEEGAKREAILNNVIQLIQSAAVTPGKQHFGIAVKNLNEYFEQGTRPADYYLTVDSRKFLQAQQIIGSAEAVRELESPTFGIMDARHIEDCMMYNEVAHRIAGERLPGETGDLPRVRRLFEWMGRQVLLVPDGSLAPPGGQQAYSRPYDVLLRGMATESPGGWSERGWLLMSLCRQLNIDVGLLSYTPKRAPAAISIVPVNESTAQQPVVWICVALVDGKAYLFDQMLGMPIPDARGDGVATLQEALTDPQILQALDLPGQIPYRTSRASLLASGKLTILIDSSRGYFSPKMRLLQSRLTGKNRAVLFRDPVEQGRHFAQVLGDKLGDLQVWPLPYATETLLFTQPEFTQATLYTLRPFDGELPLLYARVAQLKGQFAEAMSQYGAMRFRSGAFKRDKKTTITDAEQREIDVYATYFLALCHLEQGNATQAALFFKQLLERTPEPLPNRREFCYMFRWGALTNLGLLAGAAGDAPTASRYLSTFMPTTQCQGNLWIARAFVWRDPFSKAAPPLPPAPKSPTAVSAMSEAPVGPR